MAVQFDAPVRTPAPQVNDAANSADPVEMPRKPLRMPGEYEGNPVGLSREACEEIGADLDKHLAAFAVLYHQYHKHHWLVKGPQFRDLHLFFEEHYERVHKDYDAIAERLTALGFVPTCGPSAQERLSYLRHEPEGYFPVRDMLEVDILAEATVCARMRGTLDKCVRHSDHGTRDLLSSILRAAEDRAHHLEHFLEDDTLEVGNIVDEDSLRER